MAHVLILGVGMVGSTMAADLASDSGLDVTVADLREENLARTKDKVHRLTGRTIRTMAADLSQGETITRLAKDADIVLGALSSTIGFRSLNAVIDAGKPYVDISFMAQNMLEADARAKSRGVTAVVDCGVAPGLSNMLAGYGHASLDECANIEIYVGGLPLIRRWPFDYKAAFSPADVIEEYTRPARFVEHGQVITREALSEPELMDFPLVGTLEAFNTDGLRTLIDTLSCPNMKEKTLRYPGHIALMRVFRETGLFSHEPVRLGGQSVRPIDLTSALLFPKWQYHEGEEDVTVMRVIAAGVKGGKPARRQWDLSDRFDVRTSCTSMSRTTAFPATIIAREILAGRIDRPGVLPPEVLGAMPGMVDRVIKALEAKGVTLSATVEGP